VVISPRRKVLIVNVIQIPTTMNLLVNRGRNTPIINKQLLLNRLPKESQPNQPEKVLSSEATSPITAIM
jgi:hypothetical protein